MPLMIERLRQTATARYVLLQLLLTTLSALLVYAFLAWRTERVVETATHRLVTEEILLVTRHFNAGGFASARTTVEEAIAASRGDRLAIRLEDGQGHALAGNLAAWPPVVAPGSGWQTLSLYRVGATEPRSFSLRAVALGPGRLLVGRERDERQAVLGTLYESFALGMGLTVLAGLVGGYIHARFTLAQLSSIAGTARSIMAGDRSGRIHLSGSDDEFDRLGHVLNNLLDSQERQRSEIEAVATSLAHDIRTPLARMRQAVETAQRGEGDIDATLERIDSETGRLLTMVSTLIETSRARWGVGRESFDIVDVSTMVEEIAELYAPVAADAGMPISVAVAPGLVARGNRQLLAQALVNLIENALRHARGSPDIAISAGATAAGEGESTAGEVAIRVADRGPGIPAADRNRVKGAFVRLDASRSGDGHGLGLSLVAAAAMLHGGTLQLGDNEPGLVATLLLPAG